MAKLSDIFLNVLGNTLGAGGISPQQQQELALAKQQLENQKATSLAHLASQFDFQPPQASTPTVTAGTNGVQSAPPPVQAPAQGIPVPGMNGYTMRPKVQTTSFIPFVQDASGNMTEQAPITVPKGAKPLIGRPLTPKQTGGLNANQQNKEWADLENDINPGAGKNKTMAQNLAKKQSAEAVLTLMQQANGNPNVLQAPEIAQSVAMLLQSNNGRTAQEQLDKLTPKSLKGDIMKQLAYFSNQPAGLGQQAFFKSLSDTAQREGSLRGSQILQEQLSRLPRHEHLKNIDPQTYSRILVAHGVDLSQRDSSGAPLSAGLLTSGNGPSAMQQPALMGHIRVRNKITGQTGQIPQGNFDPNKYDQL